jgi:tetratricopeptide (TPR) repeat protein
VRGGVDAFRLWKGLQADADARICLGFKRQQEILSERLRDAQARSDTAGEERARHMLRRVQDNELSYHQSRMADLAAHVLADRAPSGAIGPDVPKLPEPERAVLESAATVLGALRPAQSAVEHFLRGNAFYAAERYEEALNEYNAALALRPDDPDTLNNRGNVLDDLERYEEALADYNRSLKQRPDHPNTLNNRGAALGDLGRYEDALADFNRSLELHPDDPDTLYNRGTALGRLKRYEEALRDLNRSLKLRPDHPRVLSNRGVTLRHLDRSEEALADHNRAVGLAPDDPIILDSRAVTLGYLKRYEEALADFNRALQLQPDHPATMYNLACLYSLWERHEESLQWLEKAIAGDAKYRPMAREDEDFEGLRNHPEWAAKFLELVGTGDQA